MKAAEPAVSEASRLSASRRAALIEAPSGGCGDHDSTARLLSQRYAALLESSRTPCPDAIEIAAPTPTGLIQNCRPGASMLRDAASLCFMVCSFCGKAQEDTPHGRRVIGGPGGVAICSDCVRLCVASLETEP